VGAATLERELSPSTFAAGSISSARRRSELRFVLRVRRSGEGHSRWALSPPGTGVQTWGRLVKEAPMGTKDKASNKVQDVKGKVKETVGKVTGDEDLEKKGKSDQVKASVKDVGESVKDVGEKVKDAASEVKDAVTGK
jgi:uncharacterized protein YjbJ (UPF0337 family)